MTPSLYELTKYLMANVVFRNPRSSSIPKNISRQLPTYKPTRLNQEWDQAILGPKIWPVCQNYAQAPRMKVRLKIVTFAVAALSERKLRPRVETAVAGPNET